MHTLLRKDVIIIKVFRLLFVMRSLITQPELLTGVIEKFRFNKIATQHSDVRLYSTHNEHHRAFDLFKFYDMRKKGPYIGLGTSRSLLLLLQEWCVSCNVIHFTRFYNIASYSLLAKNKKCCNPSSKKDPVHRITYYSISLIAVTRA